MQVNLELVLDHSDVMFRSAKRAQRSFKTTTADDTLYVQLENDPYWKKTFCLLFLIFLK